MMSCFPPGENCGLPGLYRSPGRRTLESVTTRPSLKRAISPVTHATSTNCFFTMVQLLLRDFHFCSGESGTSGLVGLDALIVSPCFDAVAAGFHVAPSATVVLGLVEE